LTPKNPKEKEDNDIRILSPVEFLKLGHGHWIEAHWSFCGTSEQADEWFRAKGYDGGNEFFAMSYIHSDNKNNPSIFGWWMPIEE